MKPPGHTCFAIDRALRAMRQLAWRASHPEHNGQDSAQILNEGMRELEVVREENKQMRAAHAHLTKRLAENLDLLRREADLAVGCGLLTSPERLRDLVALMEKP